jgi:hypothetical protein
MARLTRDDIIAGWIRIGELASQAGQAIELLAVGGAVMAVHFRSRDATADVDAVFEPARETRAWAAIVAEERAGRRTGSTTEPRATSTRRASDRCCTRARASA